MDQQAQAAPAPTPGNAKADDRITFKDIFRQRRNPETLVTAILLLSGLLFGFFTLGGALLGYRRAYARVMAPKDMQPVLAPAPKIVHKAMLIGGIVGLVFGYICYFLFGLYLDWLLSKGSGSVEQIGIIVGFVVNLTAIAITYGRFEKWRTEVFNQLAETERYGTARYAHDDELADLAKGAPGIYIGDDIFRYSPQGHLLTVAGTRGGKGINLIMPNLLGKGGYKGSWVVIDPKGENAAVTARYQRERGQKVLVLDPWKQVAGQDGEATYNPLDLLGGADNENLADDASVIAEMIVPTGGSDFFVDRARSLITGLIVHLVLSQDEENRNLGLLWQWLRLPAEKWAALLAEMGLSSDPIPRATAAEISSIRITSAPTYGSIMSVAQSLTDFLKSPALQRSMRRSNFNINSLSDGKTTLYIVIPADKLKSHYQWLRLLVTTALRAVVRNKGKRVTFLLDEFAALGYLGEIEVALSTYAGYNITIWAILQNLVQLNDLYGSNWQTFLGNTAVKQFFSVGDNFTAEYISKLLGTKSVIAWEATATGRTPKATARPLATPSEVMRFSANYMFTFIEQRPPTYFLKFPYWEMRDLVDGGRQRWNDNPYFK